jgi:putative transposase
VKAHAAEYPIRTMCRLLSVSRAGYYAWRKRPQSPQSRRREQLTGIIQQAHADSRKLYGSPRVHAAMVAAGERCCLNTVAKIMRSKGLRSRTKRKYKATTHSDHNLPVAGNLLGRSFRRNAPNQVWVGDITYVWTREGWLYLAALQDLYSRMVVGWDMAERMTADLVVRATTMAIERRRPPAGLIHHSDRGGQYCSHVMRDLLKSHQIQASMSRKADCYDNAVAESFFATLKKELISFAEYTTRVEAKSAIFEYIEVFYNRRRLHSTLGYLTPAAYEQTANSIP